MWNYPDPIEGDDIVQVQDYVSFYWDKVDTWLENDQEVTQAS